MQSNISTQGTKLVLATSDLRLVTAVSFLAINHILIDCTCFGAARQRYLGVDTLKDLFANVESQHVSKI